MKRQTWSFAPFRGFGKGYRDRLLLLLNLGRTLASFPSSRQAKRAPKASGPSQPGEREVAYATRDSHRSPASSSYSLQPDACTSAHPSSRPLVFKQWVKARHAPREDLQSSRLLGALRFLAADSTPHLSRPLRKLDSAERISTASPTANFRLKVCLVLMLKVARDDVRKGESIANRKDRE